MFKYITVVLAIFGSSALAGNLLGAPIALSAAPAAISTSSGIVRSQPALLSAPALAPAPIALSAPALAPAPLALGAPGLLAPRTIISSSGFIGAPALAPAPLTLGAPGLLAPRTILSSPAVGIAAHPAPLIRSSIW
ncbi:neuropeptide-like 3 [Chrysoperla carnea]|uniref:neuropeptide-like 3 n=1 Tax=Chrysoperla carnea TaxID=189513 RepID=UPI001D07C241|nr:neuropeptide-like 3 [Chrysoperla carnea]